MHRTCVQLNPDGESSWISSNEAFGRAKSLSDVAINIFLAWYGPGSVYRSREQVGSNWTTTP